MNYQPKTCSNHILEKLLMLMEWRIQVQRVAPKEIGAQPVDDSVLQLEEPGPVIFYDQSFLFQTCEPCDPIAPLPANEEALRAAAPLLDETQHRSKERVKLSIFLVSRLAAWWRVLRKNLV
jgi:hypothetical protein